MDAQVDTNDILMKLVADRPSQDPKEQSMYDIYLYMGCQALPDFQEVATKVPTIMDPAFQQKILQRAPQPGWLNLALPYDVARQLFLLLKNQKATGLIALAAYHHPQVTSEQAELVARPALEQKQAAEYPTYRFEHSIYLTREQPTCWEFASYSEELVREGHIPGGVSVCVDKLDSHVWGPEEFERLQGE
jgi:hypothetical protein